MRKSSFGELDNAEVAEVRGQPDYCPMNNMPSPVHCLESFEGVENIGVSGNCPHNDIFFEISGMKPPQQMISTPIAAGSATLFAAGEAHALKFSLIGLKIPSSKYTGTPGAGREVIAVHGVRTSGGKSQVNKKEKS